MSSTGKEMSWIELLTEMGISESEVRESMRDVSPNTVGGVPSSPSDEPDGPVPSVMPSADFVPVPPSVTDVPALHTVSSVVPCGGAAPLSPTYTNASNSSGQSSSISALFPAPRNAKLINIVINLPDDSLNPSFKGPMTRSLFTKILQVLVLRSGGSYAYSMAEKTWSKERRERLISFVRKNMACLFSHKNVSKPVYSLKMDAFGDFVVCKETGLPVILHTKYSTKYQTVISSTQQVVFKEILPNILHELHYEKTVDGSLTCRPTGINKLSNLFQSLYFYKGVFAEIRSFLKNCKYCKINIPLPMTQAAPPKPIRSYRPHERIQYDLIDMAPSKKRSFMSENPWNFRYILTIKCCFSKYCWLFPLQKKSASNVYQVMKFLFDVEGPPEILQSDNGKEFVNALTKKLSQDYGFRLVRGKPYTPQHQGQVERLNRTVKVYLKKFLQRCTKEDQAKNWPLLLPGIANCINKSYHFTIDDIPFRVYRNREANLLSSTIVPEDSITDLEIDIGQDNGDGTIDEVFVDGDDDGSCLGVDDDELIINDETCSKLESDIAPSYIAASDLMQSCLGSSLSKSTLTTSFDNEYSCQSKDLEDDSCNEESEPCIDEEQFSTHKFSSALFEIAKAGQSKILSVLESTENTIHKNIECKLKKCPGEKFNIGDSVLIKNPNRKTAKGAIQGGDPLSPYNIIGEVIEALPSGMYKLRLSDGSTSYQKDLFEGEMVLFKRKETTETPPPNNATSSLDEKKNMLNAISDFALQIRRRISRSRRRQKTSLQLKNYNNHIAKYFDILDHGVLAELCKESHPEKQVEMYNIFSKGLDDLKKINFPFFLYGSVAWERRRRFWLSDKLLSFLSKETHHQCVDCFCDTQSICRHPCCQQLALSFAERCGVKSKLPISKEQKKLARNRAVKRSAPSKMKETSVAKKKPVPDVSKSESNVTSSAQVNSQVPCTTLPIAMQTILSQALDKCSYLLASPAIKQDYEITALLQDFEMTLKRSTSVDINKMKNFEINLLYFLNVAFVDTPDKYRTHVSTKVYNLNNEKFKAQLQGSTTLCGMCALNNVFGKNLLQPDLMNQIADKMWLQQVNHLDISDELEKFRSLHGDYNLDVLLNSAKSCNFDYTQVTTLLASFFENIEISDVEKDHQNLFKRLMKFMGIEQNEKLLLSLSSTYHYLACMFFEDKLLIIDSLEGLKAYDTIDALFYLWQLKFGEEFGLYKFRQNYVVIPDDDKSDISHQNSYSVSQIFENDSPIENSAEISESFPHVSAYDLQTLKGNRHVNDSIIAAVGMAINEIHKDTSCVDPILTKRIAVGKKIQGKTNKQIFPKNKTRILFPVNSNNHWWLLSVNIENETYSVFDSLRMPHYKDVDTILHFLSANGYPAAKDYSMQHVFMPSQGQDSNQCGMFLICILISQANQAEATFSLFDMHHVREMVALHITNSSKEELCSTSIWQGDTSDQEIRRYLQRFHPEQLQIDAENLQRIYGQDKILLALTSDARRYVFEKEKQGHILPTGFHYAVCTQDELNLFLHWRKHKRSEFTLHIDTIFLTPTLRRFLQEEYQNLWDEVYYLGEGWIQISTKDCQRFNNWCDELEQRLEFAYEQFHD